MKTACFPSTLPSVKKNGRRISFISNATAATHTRTTPQNGCAARRSNHHDA
jgi:hypothetical protein